jgi:FdhD protein
VPFSPTVAADFPSPPVAAGGGRLADPPDWCDLPPTDVRAVDVVRWDGDLGRAVATTDELAEEEPLEIRVRGRAVSVTMRTPGHDAELAVGFLLSEGIVRRPADVLRVEPCGRSADGNVVNVVLAPDVFVDFDRLTRHVFASSSCGLCGKATIDAVRSTLPPIPVPAAGDAVEGGGVTFGAAAVAAMPDVMRAAQATFARTGGLHAAALFDAAGRLVVAREDVGRHNAVDKVIGHALLAARGGECEEGDRGDGDQAGGQGDGGFPLDRHLLLVSGRTSFEILQKALAARIPVVAAVSAPSGLAARFAAASGQTLVGFLRGRRMNVYAHPERIRFG